MPKGRSKTKNSVNKYTIELTPLSASLWMVFLFFLLAWIFVLGILVGRGFLPETVTNIADLRGQIDKLQEIVGHKDLGDKNIKKEPEPDPKLAFYEKLSSKKQEVKEANNPPSQSDTDRLKEEKADPGEEPVQFSFDEDKKVENVTTANDKISEIPYSDAKYTIQIASLGERDKAVKLVNGLVDKGYPAYFYEARVENKVFFRIRCGKFQTREEAQRYSKRLASEEGIRGFVTRLE